MLLMIGLKHGDLFVTLPQQNNQMIFTVIVNHCKRCLKMGIGTLVSALSCQMKFPTAASG